MSEKPDAGGFLIDRKIRAEDAMVCVALLTTKQDWKGFSDDYAAPLLMRWFAQFQEPEETE